MKTNFKGVIGSLIVISALLIGKSAFAADCKKPMVFVSGVQQYAAANNSTPVAHDGDTMRVRLYCRNGTQGSVTSNDLPKKQDNPEVTEKKGNVTTVLVDAFAEFEGQVHGNVGESKDFVFTDGHGTTYTVTIVVAEPLATQGAVNAVAARVDGKADKGDSYTKPESDARYEPVGYSYSKPEADDRFAPKGSSFGNDGRTRLELQPLAYIRTGGYDVAGGLAGAFTYHVGPANEIGFEVVAFAGWARGMLPNRPVAGVPLTEPNVFQDVTWWGVLAQAGFPLGTRVDIVLGGGPFMRWLHVPDTNIGQAADGTVWNNHAQNDIEAGLALNAGINFMLTGDQRRGVFLGLGTTPQLPFMKSYKSDGGPKETYAASIDVHGALGARF